MYLTYKGSRQTQWRRRGKDPLGGDEDASGYEGTQGAVGGENQRGPSSAAQRKQTDPGAGTRAGVRRGSSFKAGT